MSPAGFEAAISASERMQTLSLDRLATGIGLQLVSCNHSNFVRAPAMLLPFPRKKRKYKYKHRPVDEMDKTLHADW
jgi:hypothetical protein